MYDPFLPEEINCSICPKNPTRKFHANGKRSDKPFCIGSILEYIEYNENGMLGMVSKTENCNVAVPVVSCETIRAVHFAVRFPHKCNQSITMTA